MGEPVEKQNRDRLQAAIYVCCLVIIAILATQTVLSQFFVHFGTSEKRLAAGQFFDPANPDVYIKLGELAWNKQDYGSAAENFQRAVDLRPNDFVLWWKLAYSLSKVGEHERSMIAYETSLALAPNYAQPNRLMGWLLLDAGDDEKAFAYFRKAAAANPAFYSELLEVARVRHATDPEAIERFAAPSSVREKKLMIAYMINHDLVSNGVKEALIGHVLTDDEKDLFIRDLISRDKIHLAYEVWSSKTSVANLLPKAGEKIFDGGFEAITASDNAGFGWRLEKKLEGASVSIDTSRFQTGSRALTIKYQGNTDLGTAFISQLVPVEPHTNYRLSFAVLSNELTSGALPIMTVTSGKTLLARSPAIEATGGKWVLKNVEFRTGDQSAVLIALQRSTCASSPCPIFGELSLDDISLVQTGS